MENDGNAAAAPRAALVFKKERREVVTDFGEEGVDIIGKESHPQSSLNRKKQIQIILTRRRGGKLFSLSLRQAVDVLLKISETVAVMIFLAISRIIGVKAHFTFPSIGHTVLISIKSSRT